MKLAAMISSSAVLLCACGGSSPEAKEPRATAAATSAPASTEHIDAANRACQGTDAKLDRVGERLRAVSKAIEKASRAERKPLLERSRRAWLDQGQVLKEDFTKLRALKKQGADPAYDRFMAAWAQLLNPTEGVAEYTGKDQELLEANYGRLQQAVDTFGDAADNAGLPECAAVFEA